MDLVIRRAKLRGSDSLVDIGINAGYIVDLAPRITASAAEMEQLYTMITCSVSRAMGLPGFELKVGAPAHLVVLNAPNILEALRYHEAPSAVISHGRVVDPAAMWAIIQHNEKSSVNSEQ